MVRSHEGGHHRRDFRVFLSRTAIRRSRSVSADHASPNSERGPRRVALVARTRTPKRAPAVLFRRDGRRVLVLPAQGRVQRVFALTGTCNQLEVFGPDPGDTGPSCSAAPTPSVVAV